MKTFSMRWNQLNPYALEQIPVCRLTVANNNEIRTLTKGRKAYNPLRDV